MPARRLECSKAAVGRVGAHAILARGAPCRHGGGKLIRPYEHTANYATYTELTVLLLLTHPSFPPGLLGIGTTNQPTNQPAPKCATLGSPWPNWDLV